MGLFFKKSPGSDVRRMQTNLPDGGRWFLPGLSAQSRLRDVPGYETFPDYGP